MKYLVTWSDHYYPCSGKTDWVKMFDTIGEASSFSKGFAEAKDDSGSLVIIAIDTDVNSWVEVDRITTTYR